MKESQLENISFTNKNLNDSQQEAIKNSLASSDVSLIHGPPGTGKTTTVVELIVKAVELQKNKVLACAPSNIAVDNIIERIGVSNPNIRVIRLGHPARLLESIQHLCLDAIVLDDKLYGKEINSIRREMNKLQQKLVKLVTYSEKKKVFAEFKDLKKELKSIEQVKIKNILASADVICCTLTSSNDKKLSKFLLH